MGFVAILVMPLSNKFLLVICFYMIGCYQNLKLRLCFKRATLYIRGFVLLSVEKRNMLKKIEVTKKTEILPMGKFSSVL